MIITRTPFRISFVGGGSDLRDFYRHSAGAVLSTTINKFIYVCSHRFFDEDRLRIKYSQTENVNSVDEIKHPIVREVLKKFNTKGALEISSNADELETRLSEREKQTLQNTRQREYRRDKFGRRYPRVYTFDGDTRRRRGRGETEIVTGTEPMVDTLRLRNELALVLNDLIRGYNRAIALTRRWPGALPQDMTPQTLEQRLVAARTLQNDVVYRRGGIVEPGAGVGPGGWFNRDTGYTR